ncbi:MAG TPA: DNA polymerase domain-containing protein [Thermomicrobiales bacterium]|mgnify:CR=1 FL=1|nr:DNA polymerase domain-containing protein [Thermomicrobiales bacterium]
MAHPEYHRGATGYTPESGDDRVQMTDAGTRQAEDLFGVDQTPGIVAVERSGDRGIRLYYRTRDGLRDETVEFRPWLVVDPETAAELPRQMERIELNGSGRLRVRCEAPNWTTWLDVYRSLREAGRTFASFASAADQYLVDSGRGLFRGMPFDSLIRAQVDIETLGLDPAVDDARIVLITAAINGDSTVVFRGDELSEPDMILALTSWLHSHDPDVIEGHNIFNFDLPYLVERARQHRLTLEWGRDGSPLRIAGEQRFKAGARSIPYSTARVYGRHVVDTYQQIQRYDTTGQLSSYALKAAVQALGLARHDRTYVAGVDIADAWTRDRERLIRYALDDDALSELALPTEFYQARILPRGLQSVATGGPGEKINDLMLRAYLSRGHSIPVPGVARGYPGGYTELRRTGRFSPVVKCDVESLYPSIMLTEDIRPASDDLGVFVPMLRILTQRRLHAKRREQTSEGRERAQWRGIQTSFKVLINSFYGYLGYSRGYFNDFDAAERVTLRGQVLIQQIVDELEARGARAIEVDTDGVFFEPPEGINSLAGEEDLVGQVSATLPAGINLAHDGRYRGMLSLRLKNYALLGYDNMVTLKGSGLRSRREEGFLRQFLHDEVARHLAPEQFGDPREEYLDLAQRILDGTLTVEEVARVETVTDQTFVSPATRRLAEAVRGERVGERVAVYERADGSLAKAAAFANDANPTYLLRRLRDIAERFRPLYESDQEFEYTFPVVTQRTDLDALRAAQPTNQLSLFDLDD